ncbi:MAG: lactonase family protein, partial [Bryobacteraceae bacterium]
ERTSVTSSNGKQPESIAIFDGLVYVLNSGAPANVSGFRLREDGRLIPLPQTPQPLSTAAPVSPQIGFDDDGGLLLATEKATNLIDTYVVGPDGTLMAPMHQMSAGQTPFGFLFDRRGHLLVTDAFGGAAGKSATSSYNVSSDGTLRPVTGLVNNGQSAACWIAVALNSHYVYVSNTGSNNISAYSLDHDGSLRLIGNGAAANTGLTPVDLAVDRDSRFLYVLNDGSGTIGGYGIQSDGSLHEIGTFGSLPLSSTGLAAR